LSIEAVEARPAFEKIEGVSQFHGLPRLLKFIQLEFIWAVLVSALAGV
jgi:hypothetical protein